MQSLRRGGMAAGGRAVGPRVDACSSRRSRTGCMASPTADPTADATALDTSASTDCLIKVWSSAKSSVA